MALGSQSLWGPHGIVDAPVRSLDLALLSELTAVELVFGNPFSRDSFADTNNHCLASFDFVCENDGMNTQNRMSIAFAALAMVSCSPKGLNLPSQTSITARSNSNLVLSATSNNVSAGSTIPLQVSGGVPPYTFAVLSGGGSLVTSPLSYTAPYFASSVVLSVTDFAGSTNTLDLNVVPGAAISVTSTATNLKPAQMALLQASGGSPPYAFTIASGSGSVDISGMFVAGSTPGLTTVNVSDTAGNVTSVNITVDPNSGTTTGIIKPMAVAAANEWFDSGNANDKTWIPANVVDNNVNTVYSSPLVAGPDDLVGLYLAAWLPTKSAVSVSYLVLTAFFNYSTGVALGFPETYTISVTNEANTAWISVGTYTNKPNASGVVVIPLQNGPYLTYGVMISPVQAGPTVYGQYAMQFSELHLM